MKLNILPWQHEFLQNRKRNNVIVASRGCGKTRMTMIAAILDVLNFPHEVQPVNKPVVLVLAEDSVTLTQIFWRPFTDLIQNSELSKITTIKHQERRVIFNIGRIVPDILVKGLGGDSTGDNLRGLSYYRVYIDETQIIGKIHSLINDVISPRLDYPDSSITMIGTPDGKGSTFCKLFESAENSVHLTAYDNPTISIEKIEELRRTLPPRAFKQEVLASFETFSGKVFEHFSSDTHTTSSEEYQQYSDLKRTLVYNYCGLDCGSVNPAYAVIRLEIIGSKRIFSILETRHYNNITPVEELVQDLLNLNNTYKFERIFCPDDRRDIVLSCRKKGLKKTISVARNTDGIRPSHRTDTINNLFFTNSLFVDSTCEEAITAFDTCKRKVDREGVVLDEIVKDHNSHILDAIGYAIGAVVKGVN